MPACLSVCLAGRGTDCLQTVVFSEVNREDGEITSVSHQGKGQVCSELWRIKVSPLVQTFMKVVEESPELHATCCSIDIIWLFAWPSGN